jgi:hypothetical protein
VAKPDVEIRAHDPVYAGQLLVIDIDVIADKETQVDFIEAKLTGRQGWRIQSGKHTVSHRVEYPRHVEQLMAEGVLPGGTTTRFVARFALPADMAPTHRMRPAWAELVLAIHISIPWRIDGRYHYEFAVRVPPPVDARRTPLSVRSTARDAEHDEPRIELGLASSTLAVGEQLVGSCAVLHLDDSHAREVKLSLVPMVQITGRGRHREYRGSPHTFSVTLPPGSAGKNVPFRFAIPGDLVPTFATATHALGWWLVAQTGSLFRGRVDVAAPLVLVDAAAQTKLARLAAPPRLGDARAAAVFATFAERGAWRVDETAEGGAAAVREVDGCELSLAYAYRGADGTYLVATVAPPRLGLGLGVTPSSSLRHVFFADVEVDIDAWDRAHHVVARAPAQAIPFLREVVPALMQVEGLGPLARWTDDALVFERPLSAIDVGMLDDAAALLVRVAAAVVAALPAIGPPPDVTVDVAAWTQLAARLEGRLVVGDLGLDGTLDGRPVDAGLVWRDGVPARVRVAVGDPEAASAELRAIELALAHPAADVLQAGAAERLVDSVTRWPLDVANLRVHDGVASAELVVPEGARPVIDAERVRALIEALRAVLATLDPGAGPYR